MSSTPTSPRDKESAELRAAHRFARLLPLVARLHRLGHGPRYIKRTLGLSDAEYEQVSGWCRIRP